MAAALMSVAMMAGENDLKWDYTDAAPSKNPDNGLYYGSIVNDGPGTKNGLRGIKFNSSGFAAFTKAPVAGRLKLSFGPRSGNNAADIEVWSCTWGADGKTPAKGDTKYATTGQQTEYGTQVIELTAEQNDIYLCRGVNTEAVLQKIEFKEGTDDTPDSCEIIFKDQNGKELGRLGTIEGATLDTLPDASVLPAIGEGNAFRGWFYSSAKKAQIGDIIAGNTTIQAKVTPIEVATVGSVWIYDFSSPIFYPEDHDLIEVTENGVTVTLAGAKAVIIVKTTGGQVNEKRTDGETSTKIDIAVNTIATLSVYNVLDYVAKDDATGYYIVPANDVASFLLALVQAESGDKIFPPNGVYDLGETVLTTISKNNIAIIGQSMEGVIIKNAPDAATESIDKTATIKINKNVAGTYMQDLTIQNALDYYKNDNGRAVALWDQGTKTVCKNVRLLSYQDTYYSNLQKAVKYFEDCEIHGTVDFICGDGSVYFKNNLLYCEKRKKDGGGSDALTASNADALDNGYVFEGCTIKSECPVVSFGRAWNGTPQTAFLNTLVDYSAGQFGFESSDIQRWTKKLMNSGAWPVFVEYNTHLADGTVLTPASNVVTFVDEKSGNDTRELETVLSAEGAANRTMESTLGDWATTASADAKQAVCEKEAAEFEPNGIYLVEADGKFAAIILGSEYMDRFAKYDGVNYTVRKANARGGFGKMAGEEPQGIDNTAVSNTQTKKIIRDGQIVIVRDNKEYSVLGAQL